MGTILKGLNFGGGGGHKKPHPCLVLSAWKAPAAAENLLAEGYCNKYNYLQTYKPKAKINPGFPQL